MTLPYSTATSGEKALGEIQKILRAFGCNKVGSMVDDGAGELLVQFEYRGRMVSVKAPTRGYAAAWLKETRGRRAGPAQSCSTSARPWTSRAWLYTARPARLDQGPDCGGRDRHPVVRRRVPRTDPAAQRENHFGTCNEQQSAASTAGTGG